MAVQEYYRSRNRLTKDNFSDAIQLDLEFNNIADYVNLSLLPAIKEIHDNQIIPDPDNAGKYLYENEFGIIDWADIPTFAVELEDIKIPQFELAFVGQKKNVGNLDFLSVEYEDDGIVYSNNDNILIDKITNDCIADNAFSNSNFIDNGIDTQKINQYSDDTLAYINSNILGRPFVTRHFANESLPNVEDKNVDSSSQNTYFRDKKYSQYMAKIDTLPVGMFGNDYKYQLTSYTCDINYWNQFASEWTSSPLYYLSYSVQNNLATRIAQDLADEEDYATGDMVADQTFWPLFLTLTPVGAPLCPMKLPSRVFADKSIGISGADIDLIREFSCISEKLYEVNGKYNAYNTYDINDLLKYVKIEDYIENGIIDETFFSKKIQDKINAI